MEPNKSRDRLLSWGGAALAFVLLLALLLYFAFGRSQAPVRVETMVLGSFSDVSGALSAEQVERIFREAFDASADFELLGQDEAKSGAGRLVLELAVTRPRPEAGAEALEATAEILFARRVEGITERYPSNGHAVGEGRAEVESLARRAIEQALKLTAAQARALEKTSGALKADLRSEDEATRLASAAILAERGDAAAADFLLEQLRSNDLTQVRRAVGGLVRLRERRAVPHFIELSRTNGLLFQREMLFAMAEIGGEEAHAYLLTVAEGHADEGTRMAAREALSQLERRAGGEE